MFIPAFILGLVIVSNFPAGAIFSSRIVGGKDAEDAAYPYQVSIRVKGVHKCGGSLVGRSWILTAAHCLYKYDPNQMNIVLGSNNLLSDGIAYRAAKFHLHPDYVPGYHEDDIGLIRLKGPVEYSQHIAPVAIPTSDVDLSTTAIFTGWGYKKKSGRMSIFLQMLEVKLVNLEECQRTFPSANDRNICTLGKIGEGLCYGDSGSPLVADGIQIGIGSWGSPCALGYPDVYTRVYSYYSWIMSYIGDGNESEEYS